MCSSAPRPDWRVDVAHVGREHSTKAQSLLRNQGDQPSGLRAKLLGSLHQVLPFPHVERPRGYRVIPLAGTPPTTAGSSQATPGKVTMGSRAENPVLDNRRGAPTIASSGDEIAAGRFGGSGVE